MRVIAALGLLFVTAATPSTAGAVPEAVVISDAGIVNPKAHAMENGDLLVVGEVANPAGLIFAVGQQDGTVWQSVRKPLPREITTANGFDGIYTQPGMLCCAGGIGVASGNRDRMPVWTAWGDADWSQASLLNSTDRPVTHRFVTSLLPANPNTPRHYAAGYEAINGAMEGRIWISPGWGQYWQEEWPAGRPNASARYAQLADTAPDYSIWGWTVAEDVSLFRIDGPTGIINHYPAFQDCVAILGVSAPTANDVSVLWLKDAVINGEFMLSRSHDNGLHWDYMFIARSLFSREQRRVQGGDPPHLAFADGYRGVVAVDTKTGGGDEGWSAFTLLPPDGYRETWHPEMLTGYRVLGMKAVGPRWAYALANKYNPKTLYCLRLDLGSPPAPGAVAMAPGVGDAVVADGLLRPNTVLQPQDQRSPVLSWVGGQGDFAQGGVSPPSGGATGTFIFRVVYRHAGNQAPTEVCLQIKGQPGRHALGERRKLGDGYADGAVFAVKLDGSEIGAGRAHQYKFTATAADGTAATGEPTEFSAQRTVTIR